MLNSADHWDPLWVPPAPTSEHVWVLAPTAAFSFAITPARRGQLRRDLSAAGAAGVGETALILCPSEPLAPAYTHQGAIQDHVFAVLDPDQPAGSSHDLRTFCFVDARPLLLRVECLLVDDGSLPGARLHEQYAGRCPPGFVLCYFEQDGFVHPVDRDVRVADLDVLVLTFLPAHFIPHSQGDNGPPDQDDGQSPHGDDGSEEPHEDGDSTVASQRSASIGTSIGNDAGTGGSRRPGSQPTTTSDALNLSRSALLRSHGVAAVQLGGTDNTVVSCARNPQRLPGRTGTRPDDDFHNLIQELSLDKDSTWHTLLECSRLESEDRPLFLAWTLLEALLEHQPAGDSLGAGDTGVAEFSRHAPSHHDVDRSLIQVQSQGGAAGRDLRAPRPINLAEHLPQCPTFDLSTVSVDIGASLDQSSGISTPQPETFSATALSLTERRGLLYLATSGMLTFDGVGSSWAFVAFGWSEAVCYFLGWQAGVVQTSSHSPDSIGASEHNALAGEYSALIWALYWGHWGTQICTLPSLAYHADCLSALQQANGNWGSQSGDPLMIAARALLQLLCAVQPAFKGTIGHVHSHQGQPGNELADSVAKFAVRTAHKATLTDQAAGLAQAIRDGSAQWWWLICTGTAAPHAWPQICGPCLSDHSRLSDTLPPSDREAQTWFGYAPGKAHKQDQARLLRLRILTVNVQTLNDPTVTGDDSRSFKGKAGFLREQLDTLQIHVTALQETRALANDTITSQSHIRFCSGRAPNGCLGVELWFSRVLPFLGDKGSRMYFQPGDFIVVFADPRTLVVRFARGGVKVLFVCVHGPTTCDQQRDSWWAQLHERLHRFSEAHEVVLLGDYNTHFSTSIPGRVGALVLPGSGSVPIGLQRILQSHDIWLPATFPDIHQGPSLTWVAPSGTSGSRIDFVGIPCTWIAGPQSSCVQTGLDWGQGHTDHYAAQVEGSHVHSWTANVHRHGAVLEDYLNGELAAAFPNKRGPCRSSHFSEHTWNLRQRRVWLRRQILRCREGLAPPAVRAPFVAWRRRCRLSTAEFSDILLATGRHRRLLGFAAELRQTRKLLRQAVRHDVQHRITTVAAEAEHCATAEAVRRLKPILGPPKRKARTHKGLPLVLMRDGNPATTAEEVEDTWVQHFAGAAKSNHRGIDLIPITKEDLPSRIELETALRATSTGRASGLDGIPGEALHFAVAAASEALYPLLLKTSLRLAEPVQFKGGSLEAAWKGKGSPAGKPFIAFFPLQLGGLPSCPVTAVSHSVRLFVAAARARKRSFAVLFLDLQEAFYRVCRPLLTGESLSDEAIAHVATTIRLPHGVLHELHLHLSGGSVFEGSGASPWLSQAMGEVLEATWFRFKAGPSLVQTGIGSRPGDNCADVIFSFLFSRVLQELSKDMAAMGCTTQLPYQDSMRDAIFQTPAGPSQSIDIFDATWMDDLALMMLSDSAESVVTKAGQVTGALIDACLSRALLPNLARGKTELIIVPSGAGSKGVRARLFRDKEPSIAIPSRLWTAARVRVVTSYRHLGGTIHFTGDLAREVRSRVALAHDAFQKRKRQIFGSPAVPKSAKATLYNSLILSVLLHGAGTWPSLSETALSSLGSAYERMACHMCRPHWDFDQALHAGRDQVLAYLGLPSITVLLHIHRLIHLLLFVRLKLGQLWALAHWEGDWLASVRSSLDWLWRTVRHSSETRPWEAIWPDWLHQLHTAPGKWKSLLKRAQAKAIHVEAWQAAHHRHCALLIHQLQRQGAVLFGSTLDRQDMVHCCALCRTTFSNRQKWSVHAFKCHGRRMAGRGILPGLQCQACLRTYSSNVRLCRHLRYSHLCRAKLLSLGHACAAEPGVGHRKDDDRAAGLCPVLPGSGPLCQFPQLPPVDQDMCPVAEVWDCLRLIDFDASVEDLSEVELWERLRLSFSCVCAPTDRLRMTALSWIELLHAEGGHPRLIDCAEWICNTDIVEWLVPTPAVRQSLFRTYRDSVQIIGLLDTSPVRPGPPTQLTAAHVVFWVHSGLTCAHLSLRDCCCVEYSHDECLADFANGIQPAFFEGPFDEVAFVIDLTGIHLLQDTPCLDFGLSASHVELDRATLGADLLRLFLRLLFLGVPVVLLVPPAADLCLQTVSALPGIQVHYHGGLKILSTSSDLFSLLCFTSS
ncbi:unnamed protein product [Symbiodinium sp. CCMP2592]|nr:unnamed protein product [Symbiodinium sp. CCMP2592]